MKREKWMSLNGQWEFCFDDMNQGIDDNWFKNRQFDKVINVPFTYQSKLSGIEDQSFHGMVWYKRKIHLKKDSQETTIIHFEGVDYEMILWVNGSYVGKHIGGNSSFEFDMSKFIVDGENEIVVCVKDYLEDMTIPRGKQYWKEQAEVMWFTQMTGIWRDVWIEQVNYTHIKSLRITPDIDLKEVRIELEIKNLNFNLKSKLKTIVTFDGEVVTEEYRRINEKKIFLSIALNDFNDHGLGRWWSPEQPNLYDISFELIENDSVIDKVDSYFGMRKVSIEDSKFCLNNRPYFLKLVLDQGYFPESILSSPSIEHLKKDIELTKQMGFNGVRKHMMSSDPKYLYLCDKLGLLVWGEMASAYDYSEDYAYRMIDEWKDIIKRDYNHPSIVTWVPINESWGVPNIYYSSKEQNHVQSLYHLTKSVDDTRPVISNDGWEHCKSDLFTIHDYESDEKILKERYSSVENIISDMPGLGGRKFLFCPGFSYEGQPVMCTEMGGINYRLNGLGSAVEPREHNAKDFLHKVETVLSPYLESKVIEGVCYTQLTDTETEICGLLTWNREPKIQVERIKAILDKRH
ncbi:glycoside hydrolase family 2 protein [Amphibacillus sp. Q70]|uniref:glycoside hydrolase family 2 protein n=1 Tax=Amphibacillus sp. Q70 TaxID=3453416 RepID=UPI003F850FA6